MISVQIDTLFKDKVISKKADQAAQAVLDHHDRREASLAVIITGSDKLQTLNREYRGINEPTDVLSFPSGEPDPQTGRIYLGDIIISYPKAQAQAEESGHPVMEELVLLTVHGALHLCGYGHAEAGEKDKMWAIQDQILSKLKVKARPND